MYIHVGFARNQTIQYLLFLYTAKVLMGNWKQHDRYSHQLCSTMGR